VSGVVFDGVSVHFGSVAALTDLDLDVADGELLVLLGPSGCGKSTALRSVAGLEEPDAGTISIGGRVVNGLDPKTRDVAMVFQSYALYPHKSVRDNIAFPLRTRGVPRAERDRLVDEAAASLGLDGLLDRKPGALSGGQRQRVALARAIVRRPAVFLMDEPLSNLDAALRLHTRAELVELHRRLAATFLYVTHDQVEAMTMGTRVAVLSEGRLQQVAPPQEVYDRPANTFVARFIGSPPMNLLPGSLVAHGGAPAVQVAAGAFALPAGHAASGTAAATLAKAPTTAGDVLVGFRPEDVVLTGAGQGALQAKVRVVESLGYERHVLCHVEGADDVVGGGDVVVRTPATAVLPGDGESVGLDVPPGRLHLFDVATTRRLGT
jgi:multiple sugar transport system ATP-binding protein